MPFDDKLTISIYPFAPIERRSSHSNLWTQIFLSFTSVFISFCPIIRAANFSWDTFVNEEVQTIKFNGKLEWNRRESPLRQVTHRCIEDNSKQKTDLEWSPFKKRRVKFWRKGINRNVWRNDKRWTILLLKRNDAFSSREPSTWQVYVE